MLLMPFYGFDLKDTVLVRGAMLSDMEVNLLPGYLTSPDDRFSVYKTDPVTSLGSLPVPLERNVNEPREGQNVTVVGYGSNSSWNAVDVEDGDYSYTYPGAAMEAQLQVMSHEYCDLSLMNLKLDYATEFCAVAPQENFPFNFRAAGPCLGKTITIWLGCYSRSRADSTNLLLPCSQVMKEPQFWTATGRL